MKGLIKFILPAIAALGMLSCSGTAGKYETFTGYAQGGVYSVRANLRGVRTPPQEIAETIDSLLAGIDFSISGYNRNSNGTIRRNTGGTTTGSGVYRGSGNSRSYNNSNSSGQYRSNTRSPFGGERNNSSQSFNSGSSIYRGDGSRLYIHTGSGSAAYNK